MAHLRRFRLQYVALVVVLVVGFGCSRTGPTVPDPGATTPVAGSGDFWIEAAEVSQGVQLAGLIPMLPYKRTFLRVSVGGEVDSHGTLPRVQVRATYGSTDHGRPYHAITSDTVVVDRVISPPGSHATRWSVGNTVVFPITIPTAVDGEYPDITNPPSLSISVALADGQAGPSPGVGRQRSLLLQVNWAHVSSVLGGYVVRYQYHNVPQELMVRAGLSTPEWPATDLGALSRMRPLAENLLPMKALGIQVVDASPPGDFDCAYDPATGRCSGYRQAGAWASDLIDQLSPGGGAVMVVLQPERDRDGHFGSNLTTPLNNHVVTVAEDLTNTGLALARQLGHVMGLCDLGSTPSCDPEYPRANGAVGPFTGLRYTQTDLNIYGPPTSVDAIQGEEPAGTPVTADFMTTDGPLAGGQFWISPYNYCKALFNRGLFATHGEQARCPGSLDH